MSGTRELLTKGTAAFERALGVMRECQGGHFQRAQSAVRRAQQPQFPGNREQRRRAAALARRRDA